MVRAFSPFPFGCCLPRPIHPNDEDLSLGAPVLPGLVWRRGLGARGNMIRTEILCVLIAVTNPGWCAS
jgi:hypothetical protein